MLSNKIGSWHPKTNCAKWLRKKWKFEMFFKSLKHTAIIVTITCFTGVLLSGCFGAAVGTGAWVANAVSDKRGLKNAAIDLGIRARISNLWLDHNEEIITRANIAVFNGRVLLTGLVSSDQLRQDAVRLAWKAGGAKEVINELGVFKANSLADFTRDAWISAQLKTSIALDKKIAAINYSINVVRGTVYLLGVADTADELERVLNHARQINYVRRVLSYVIIEKKIRRG
ncbi:MAG: hypothetical protein CMM83_03170 [Rhodospirillales bacterium]|nr:hypothetical protein [Rhodospirillales bacterium]